ncbi:DEAD/DEAH box helicase [Pseudomonas knackmussii]|uniref:DNA 3'-5' helicase n=1 Tax=Pseudomonas knackmussii TaxID=65741 RepID=A0ABY4KSS4_9PSED|nr:protein DpdF [Pseudomonas knackmussii]UPQ83609.1 DEAD/DEAH box helicase [Pseudomonas knackmussii]
MQAQWNALQAALLSPNHVSKSGALTESFFIRLLTVFRDWKSGPADRAAACRDALGCALANNIVQPVLQLPINAVDSLSLSRAGLVQDFMTGHVRMVEVLDDAALAVYGHRRRRYLKSVPMDVALRQKLKNDEFDSYQGLGQQAAVRTVLTSAPDSTLIINLPTGSGKTLVIHALSLFAGKQKLVLTIVPTVGLALEQAARAAEVLNRADCGHGGSYALYGGQADAEHQQVLERLKSGDQRILFCSPELAIGKLRPALFRLAQEGRLEALVVDEAHMIDHWGAGFRPEFQLLAPLFRSLRDHSPKGVRTLLMSATFSDSTLQLLKDSFVQEGKQTIEIHGGFLRPEPNFNVLKTADPAEHQLAVLEAIRHLPRPLILYTTKKKEAENWKNLLLEEGFNRIGLFYGSTAADERDALIQKWRYDELDIMVATSAFGVGMDKSGVRTVLHATVPESIDRFYQEAGRGGRDGTACWSWLVYHPGQLNIAERLSQEKLISAELGVERWKILLGSREVSGEYFTISRTALHRGLTRNSKGNEMWNLRTLQLMQRAGLIRLFFAPPEPPQFEGELTSENERNLTEYFEDYFNRIGVQILIDSHLAPEVWQQQIAPRRDQEKKARADGFDRLTGWLKDTQQPLCWKLDEFYRPSGIAPERSCGGCPGCRSQGRGVFTPTLGNIFHLRGLELSRIPPWMPSSLLLRVRYQPESYARVTTKALLHNWRFWMQNLLRTRQVQAVRASRAVLDEMYQDDALKALPFWCALDPQDSPGGWLELVLLMPGETHLPLSGFDDPPRVIVAPEKLADPSSPYRTWWECRPGSKVLESFVQESQ